MPPYRSHIPPIAKPTRNVFDPWNASLTGHQRGENPIGQSLGWRSTRTRKLQKQFRGEENEVGKEKGGKKRSVMDMLVRQGTEEEDEMGTEGEKGPTLAAETPTTGLPKSPSPGDLRLERPLPPLEPAPKIDPQPRQIFRNLTVHISGSTSPLVSDHRLKQLLASRGALIALSPARRTVTHVILGRPNDARHAGGQGAGGGLAAGKMQREIMRVRGGGGCGVRFVGVEWALDSIHNGKRLSEAGYSPMKLAVQRQRSVYGIFNVTKKDTTLSRKASEGVDINKDNSGWSRGADTRSAEEDEGGGENSQPFLSIVS